jgi:hypothetical protein
MILEMILCILGLPAFQGGNMLLSHGNISSAQILSTMPVTAEARPVVLVAEDLTVLGTALPLELKPQDVATVEVHTQPAMGDVPV